MNYTDIRSKSALPFRNIETRNITNMMPNELSSRKYDANKNVYGKFSKGKEERTYSEIVREKERLNHMNICNNLQVLYLLGNTPVRTLSKKNSNKNLTQVNSQPKFISSNQSRITNKSSAPGNSNNSSLRTINKESTQNEHVKTYLKRIFEYYSQFGERMNINFLKSHKYQKFAIDADLLDSKLTKTRLEIIFSSENKTKTKSQMDFETFLNSLVKVAEYKFMSNQNDILNKISNQSNNALQMLLKYHIWPLYERIFGNPVNLSKQDDMDRPREIDKKVSNFEIEEKKPKLNPKTGKDLSKEIITIQSVTASLTTQQRNSSTSPIRDARRNTFNMVNNLVNVDELLVHSELEDILKAISPIMYEIYKVYFPWEISLSENENYIKENSVKVYFAFLKDFDLCPSLVNKSAAFHIFQSETVNLNENNPMNELNEYYFNIMKNIEVNPLGRSNNKNIIGKFYTFIRFLKTLCKIADLGFNNLELLPNNTMVITESSDKIPNNKKLNQIEKICLTLERMELSDGFLGLEKKTSKTHSKKSARIIPKEILDRVKDGITAKMNDENNLENFLIDDNVNDEKSAELLQQNRRSTKLRKSVLGGFKDLFEYTNHLLEKYGTQLNMIYKYYCSFGDPMNTTLMKINKFSKFLREAGLIRQNNTSFTSNNSSSGILNTASNFNSFGLKMNDIDLIFFKLAGAAPVNKERNNSPHDSFNASRATISLNQSQISSRSNSLSTPISGIGTNKRGSIVNSNAKIDFTGFVNSIELVSLYIFPKKNEIEAIDYIMKNNVLSLVEKMSKKNNDPYKIILRERKENSEFVKVLEILNKAMTPIFKHYQKNSELTFEQFLRFCTDFTIFPELVSKSKLNTYFKNTTINEYIFTENGENNTIDQELFVEILALCAYEVPYRSPEPSSVEKIILFVEKIAQSNGTNKILKESGNTRLVSGENSDLLSVFIINYPEYFNLHENKKATFFDVLNEVDEDV